MIAKITVHPYKLVRTLMRQHVKIYHNSQDYVPPTRTILKTFLTKGKINYQYAVSGWWRITFFTNSVDCSFQKYKPRKTVVLVAALFPPHMTRSFFFKYLGLSDPNWKTLHRWFRRMNFSVFVDEIQGLYTVFICMVGEIKEVIDII